MRFRKAMLNSMSSILSHIFLVVLGLYVRKLFLQNFDISFLGYEGLFGSTFTILSVAEMGTSGLITYRLYRAFENNDTKEIGVLVAMLRQMYLVLGCLILAVGAVLYFFLPAMITVSVANWDYVRMVYVAQMGIALCSYFLAYCRTVYVANQQEHVAIRIETFMRTANNVLRMVAILVFRDYMLYIIIGLLTTLASNIVIAIRYKFQFQSVPKYKIRMEDYRKRKIGGELRDMFIHKVSTTIYSSADNILISIICGVQTVALYSNYLLINVNAMNLVVKTLQPLEASFGSKLYGDSKEENNSLFAGYDMFCQILASMFFVVFIVLFQPGITLLYGKEYLLPFPMVCAVAANNYIAVRQYAITAYRNALGKYNLDRNYRIASAVLNVLLSIALGKIFGVTGIIVSTAIGHLFIWMGRVKVVCAEYFCDSSYKKALCLQELVSLVKNTILAAACLAICNPLPVTVLGVLLRALVCTLLPTVVNVLIYRKDARFQAMRLYVRRILGRKRTQAPV